MRDNASHAGFGPRAAAYLIDLLIVNAALLIVRIPASVSSLINGTAARAFLFQYSALDVFCYLVTAAYFIALTYTTGSTLGKKIMRLRVFRSDGEELRFIDVLYRETVGRFLSGILFIGYFMVLADKENRSFHDWLCGTCVEYADVRFVKRVPKPLPAYSVPGEPTGYSMPGNAAPASPEAEPQNPEGFSDAASPSAEEEHPSTGTIPAEHHEIASKITEDSSCS